MATTTPINPFAAEELQEDAERCEAQAHAMSHRLRCEAEDAQAMRLLADAYASLAASAVMLQEAGL